MTRPPALGSDRGTAAHVPAGRDQRPSQAEGPLNTEPACSEGWFTCDVFDTVITRALPHPTDIFTVVAERLGLSGETRQQAFVAGRVRAEASLRRRLAEGADLRLDEIYAELFRLVPSEVGTGLSVAAAVAAEIAAERESARPWPPGLRLLEEWRRRSRFAGFLSDMYLPSSVIQEMLHEAGAWRPGDRLFTSGEYRATKASGRLFTVVKDTLSIDSATWTHFGDNPHADVTVPQTLGIRALRVPTPGPNHRTRAVFGRSQRRLRIAAALNRAAEDAPADLDVHHRAVWRIAAHVLAPTALWYADRVLRAAREDRREHLWFLARDGQIIHRAALIANRSVGFGGTLHYALASRQALHLPSLHQFDAESRRWLLANPDIATPIDVAARAGLDQASRLDWLEDVRRHRDPSAAITDAAEQVWQVLLSAPHRDRVLQIAARHREATHAYFRGISSWRGLGIVDIGWGANLQCSLQRILQVDDLRGYYLGLFSRNAEVPPQAVMPMLFDFAKTSVGTWSPGVSVLECLFAGDHPGVASYLPPTEGGGWGTMHEPASWEPQKRWGVDLMQQAACRAMELLAQEGVVPETDEVRHILQDLIHSPDKDEARVLGRWPVQNLQNRSSSECLASPVNWRSAMARLVAGRRLPPSMWRGGEAALTGARRYKVYRILQRLVAALPT